MEGTHEKQFRGIPASHKKFETVGMNIFHFQDNKIKEGWVVVNALAPALQLGAVKAIKSDPSLIHDLLRRLQENPDAAPIYMVEVFTKRGVNPEAAKKYIFEKTGMVPAIYENGTLFVTNQRLT